MKKIILSVLFLSFSVMLYNCSSNDEIQNSDQTSFSLKSNKTYEIGIIDTSGNYILHPSAESQLKQDWENLFDTTISSMKIEKHLTVDDIDSETTGGEEYFVITASDVDNSGAIVMEVKLTSNSFTISLTDPEVKVYCKSSCGCKPVKYTNKQGEQKWKCAPLCTGCNKIERTTMNLIQP